MPRNHGDRKGVWVEAALNGPWTRSRQPRIPVAVEEIVAEGIACAGAGASIVHVHAYDPVSGRQSDDAETYARIIEGIREVEDVVVYPTIPMTMSGDVFSTDAAERRFAAIDALARRGLLECCVVDPGSINLATFADVAADRPGSIYLNPEAHIRKGLELASAYAFTPSFAIYEPGFLRLGAASVRAVKGVPPPIYRFMFSDIFTFGYPPKDYALNAYLQLLESECKGAVWMVAGLGVDILPLVPSAISAGGHVRVGLEDAPLGSEIANVTWVEKAVAAIGKAGQEIARPDEIRAVLSAR